MKQHIIDELRPEEPDVDPTWASATMLAILQGRGHDVTTTAGGRSRVARWALVAATVAALVGGVFVARDHLPREEVRPAGPVSQTPEQTTAVPTTSPSPTYPHPQKPLKTYVPAPGDPTTHELRITILDRGIAYDPRTCTVLTPYYLIGFSGPSRNYENVPIGDSISIPDQAEARSDGTCASTLTVTLPYRPRYQTGVGREGKGIYDPEVDPDPTEIVTSGDSQDVTIVNYKQ
jgi:hypothetical protein